MPFPLTDVPTRFARKHIPEPNSGCWLWTDAPDSDGYGRLQIDGRAVKAHRVSYELHCGPVPLDMLVCHRCDVRACVNPAHLFLGSNLDNIADMTRKGRAPRVKNPLPGEANGRAQITEAEARAVLRDAPRAGRKAVAARLGVSRDLVDKICAGRTWRHIPR